MSEQTNPTLPPVGSLWRHKDGERRFHIDGGFDEQYGGIAVDYVEPRSKQWVTTPLANWLAWQADAVRIDGERDGVGDADITPETQRTWHQEIRKHIDREEA